jgi:hypothetical protein
MSWSNHRTLSDRRKNRWTDGYWDGQRDVQYREMDRGMYVMYVHTEGSIEGWIKGLIKGQIERWIQGEI